MNSKILVLSAAIGLAAWGCTAGADKPTGGEPANRFVCPVTVPSIPYVASPPYSAEPPPGQGAAWYGSDRLWTILDRDGETWRGLPKDGGSFTQKTFWWSRDFQGAVAEAEPAIAVSGKRLDATGSFSAGNPGTNAMSDVGDAMLVGVEIPAAGCWEISAEYRGASLSYVVRVED